VTFALFLTLLDCSISAVFGEKLLHFVHIVHIMLISGDEWGIVGQITCKW
jgi:hypothetical protein